MRDGNYYSMERKLRVGDITTLIPDKSKVGQSLTVIYTNL
jgi:hypothetical protein